MLTCEINAPGRAEFYLDALNRCFPGWGGQRQFDWCFRRTVEGPAADLMVLCDERAPVAGSAVTYRTLQLASGRRILVGIMTGSWTLPESRGKGCFTRIIQESVALTRAHRGAVLLAFVTEDNASYRRLRDAGSGLFPSAYLASPERPAAGCASALEVRPERPTDALVEEVAAQRERGQRAGHVVYASASWRTQLLERSHPTELLAIGDLGWAVVERAGAFLRLQATSLRPGASGGEVVRAALARAQAEEKRLFVFSMDPGVTAACRELGLSAAPGYLTALAADPEALRDAVQGDRPWSEKDSTPLADAKSPWYLGPITFESGDRM